MRMPYPFAVPVDPNEEDVKILVLIDMPQPHNLTVHVANEHGLHPCQHEHDRVWQHLIAHVFAEFRKGAEHFHIRDEKA